MLAYSVLADCHLPSGCVCMIVGDAQSQEIVEDLHAILTGATLKGRMFWCGHSFGGLNVMLYANRFPEEVAGIVLQRIAFTLITTLAS